MKQAHSVKPVWQSNFKIPILMIAVSILVLFSACFVLQTEKQVALFSALAILVIGLTPQFRRKLKSNCSIFFILVTAYVVYAGLSTLYGYAPKLALSEYSRILAAYVVFLAIFSFTTASSIPQAASVLSGSITILSFIHLDAASWRIIGPKVMEIFQTLTGGYLPDENGLETFSYNSGANRLYGLFGNSNTMAFMCAIGLFLAIYLLTHVNGRKRIWPCIVLIVNSVTFLLCISLGATAALGCSVCVVALLLHGARNRLTFLLITLETLIVGGIVTVLSISHLGSPGPAGYLVWVFCILGIAALYGLDYVLRPRLVDILCRRIKTLCIGVVALVVILVGGSVLLFSQPTSITLNGSEILYKRFFPGTGSCEISLDVDGAAWVQISSTSQPEILKQRSTQLLNAAYDGTITVDVPKDAIEVQMNIWPVDNGTVTVNGISYSGSEKSDEIAPGYRGIPKEILQRLQGLATNHSAMQRIVFMEDGLKLWKQTPLFGRGLGGFENGITSVQNFFYETKYAHNHLVQALCDLGIVGLLLYLGIFIAGFKALWSLRRKEDQQPFFMALFGALIMLFTHNTLEFNMSVGEGLFANFVVFGLIATTAKPIVLKRKVPITKVFVWATPAYFLVFAVLIIGNFAAASKMENSNYLDDLETAAKMDVFEGSDYLLTFIQYAPQTENAGYIARAEAHAEKLSKTHLSSAPSILSKFYYDIGQADKGAEMASLYLERNRSNPEAWNDMFRIFNTILDEALTGESNLDVVQCVDQFLGFYEKLIQVNQEQLDDVLLDQMSSTFVNRLLACGETTNATADTVKATMWGLLFDWNTAPDLDEDNIPDNVTVFSDLTRREDGSLEAPADLTVTVTAAPRVAGTFLVTAHCDNAALFSITSDVVQILSSEGDTYQCLIEISDGLQNSLNDISFLLSQGCILHDLRIEYLAE